MNKKEYFKSLVSLYEAVGMAGTEEVVPQEQIADTGMDVNGMGAAQQPVTQSQPTGEKMPMEGEEPIEDTAYLQQPMMQQPEVGAPEPSATMDKQKAVKLFGLMDDLLLYANIYNESLSTIDLNLLDFEILKCYKKYTVNVTELVEKIKSYMTNIFNGETYEKNLYNYILFRTELMTIIKGLRDVLKLNDPEDKSILDSKKEQ